MTIQSFGATRGHRLRDDVLEAWGPDRAECLAQAVRALVASFTDPNTLVPRQAVTASFEPRSDDDLLIDVLNESLYLAEDLQRVPVDIELQDRPDGTVLIHFAVVPDARLHAAIPAAALPFGAWLRQECGGWRCRAQLDR